MTLDAYNISLELQEELKVSIMQEVILSYNISLFKSKKLFFPNSMEK